MGGGFVEKETEEAEIIEAGALDEDGADGFKREKKDKGEKGEKNVVNGREIL